MTGPSVVRAVRRGSVVLADRFGAWLRPQSAKEAAQHWAALAFAGFFGGGMVLAVPKVLGPIAVVWWCIAAGRTGSQVLAREAAESAFVQLLRDAIGPRNGVLLADVLLLLHRDQLLIEWDIADVRAQCVALEIPMRDSLKVDGRVSVGVHVADLLSVWDVDPTPPPKIDNPSRGGRSAGNYPTTSEEGPAPEGVECAVQVPRRDPFEDHLADALRVFGDH